MADRQKFPNSGAIFANRAEGKRPTWTGNIELDGSLLKELVAAFKAGGDAKLAVSGWDREGQRGPWISLRVERFGAWKEKKGSGDYNRNRDDRGGRDDRDRDRGTTRSRNDDEDRRPAPRERAERTRDERSFNDDPFDDKDIPF